MCLRRKAALHPDMLCTPDICCDACVGPEGGAAPGEEA